MAKTYNRPLGVTILCLWSFFTNGIGLLAGIVLLALSGIYSGAIQQSVAVAAIPALAILPAIGAVLGIFLLAWGALNIFIYYNLWKLKKWAWWVIVIFQVLSLLVGLGTVLMGVGMGVLGLIINAVILTYLFYRKDIFR